MAAVGAVLHSEWTKIRSVSLHDVDAGVSPSLVTVGLGVLICAPDRRLQFDDLRRGRS